MTIQQLINKTFYIVVYTTIFTFKVNSQNIQKINLSKLEIRDSVVCKILDEVINNERWIKLLNEKIVINLLDSVSHYELRVASLSSQTVSEVMYENNSNLLGFIEYDDCMIVVYSKNISAYFTRVDSIKQEFPVFEDSYKIKLLEAKKLGLPPPPPPIVDITVYVYTITKNGFYLKDWGWLKLFPK